MTRGIALNSGGHRPDPVEYPPEVLHGRHREPSRWRCRVCFMRLTRYHANGKQYWRHHPRGRR